MTIPRGCEVNEISGADKTLRWWCRGLHTNVGEPHSTGFCTVGFPQRIIRSENKGIAEFRATVVSAICSIRVDVAQSSERSQEPAVFELFVGQCEAGAEAEECAAAASALVGENGTLMLRNSDMPALAGGAGKAKVVLV